MSQPRETMVDNAYPDALPAGYGLHWYVLERVLGQGGFGITYLARDTNLDRLVAIKEYLPCEVAQRHAGATVRPRTEALGARYGWGLERFIAEARTLARFDHPNIVRVYSVFEANDTAYMVMRFEEGQTLGCLLERRGTLPEAELLRILLPILDGLERVHGAGFIHRDIKPQNIHIRQDGSPVLLDFGSARQSLESPRTMTILVAPGYAPLEQYYGGAGVQGPWTDIYGLAATCYRAVTGQAPVDAIVRTKGVLGSVREVLEPASSVAQGRYSAQFLAAIDHGLELGEKDRPQSLAAWRRELVGEAIAEGGAKAGSPEAAPRGAVPAVEEEPARPELPRPRTRSARARMYRAQAFWAFAGGAMAAALAIGVFLGMEGRGGGNGSAGSTPHPPAQQPPAQQPPAQQPPVQESPTQQPPTQQPTTQQPTTQQPHTHQPTKQQTTTQQPPTQQPPTQQPTTQQPTTQQPTTQQPTTQQPTTQQPTTQQPTTQPAALPSTPPRPAQVAHGGRQGAPEHDGRNPAGGPTDRQKDSRDTGPRKNPSGNVASQQESTRPNSQGELTPPVPPQAPPERPPAPTPADKIGEAEKANVSGDYAGALKIAKPLAEAGNAQAQALLGSLYENGRGVRQSYMQAYISYGIAARLGDTAAKAAQQRVAAHLQHAEIEQADKIVNAKANTKAGEVQ